MKGRRLGGVVGTQGTTAGSISSRTHPGVIAFLQIVSMNATEVEIRLELEEHTKGISSALATRECQLVDMARVDAQLAPDAIDAVEGAQMK